jgi:hypothetical protein
MASVSGKLASMPNAVKPISSTSSRSSRCFMRKNSAVPWVPSPSATTRAEPTMALSGCRSPEGAAGSSESKGTACCCTQLAACVASGGAVDPDGEPPQAMVSARGRAEAARLMS